ncbi:unnamed protein product [Paramecium primaurelia]|uniref:Calponin-homology (CH) domain-containing protein n=1 Tax=Paramecium primaurelia TaxID=5886 RepID=A0A8S1PRE8_PARPR|nr:unnamed protein product [Paramecium primaurelia]
MNIEISRAELLQWVNDTLKLLLQKIEQLGTAAVYCQLVDAVHPGKIALNKINWKAKQEYEFVNNYKGSLISFLQTRNSKTNRNRKVNKMQIIRQFGVSLIVKEIYGLEYCTQRL